MSDDMQSHLQAYYAHSFPAKQDVGRHLGGMHERSRRC